MARRKKIAKKKSDSRQSAASNNLQDAKSPVDESSDLLDMAQAIEMLKTTRNTFYRWLRSGRIKGFKVGRQWRFYRKDLDNFLKGDGPRIDLPTDITPLIDSLLAHIRKLGARDISNADSEPVLRAVHLMIRLAEVMKASDIHIEPFTESAGGKAIISLRFRIDGVLHPIAGIDLRLLPAIIEQWKRMSGCDVLEKVRPQDGRILAEPKRGKTLDLRVSFLPAHFGESVTVRILDPSAVSLDLNRIEYLPEDMARLREALALPWGIVFLTGPTGSGKTTVLYSCLNELVADERKVLSIEDPVEYVLPKVTQIQVRDRDGLTFPVAMRSALRSDPDIILVGEIRNRESLIIAQQCALTGHLVLTTLHTDTSAGALQRQVDIGSDPFIVADATRAIVAQRLVRKLCPECSTKARPPKRLLEDAKEIAVSGGMRWTSLSNNYRKPARCKQCKQTGYRGRTVIAEVLSMSPEMEIAIRRGKKADDLQAQAIEQGMTTIGAHGIHLASEGVTTIDEVFRVLGSAR